MNNEENDIERQELARRVGKNGDRVLREYFDDIGLANKTNNEINDLEMKYSNQNKLEFLQNINEYLKDDIINDGL